MPAAPRILIVEDEPHFRAMLQSNLEAEGYLVHAEPDGIPGLAWQMSEGADLIILDLMMPQMDGFQFLRSLRQKGDEVPVIVLTARGEERARLQGFEFGADDYLAKPFSILELLCRVKAILRRTKRGLPENQAQVLKSGPFILNREKMEFRRGRKKLDIGSRGFRILEVLFLRPGHIHSRSELLNLAWEPDSQPGLRTVDAHIFLIRKALGTEKEWLATVGGTGYRWTHPVEPADL